MLERPRHPNTAFCRTSLPSALYWRSIPSSGIRRRSTVHESIYTHLSLSCVNFSRWPQVCSPHSSPITSLDVDNASEGRFLLCGSHDCTISVYDLSILGSDYHLNSNSKSNLNDASRCLENGRQRYHPVARSRRTSVGLYDTDVNHISTPTGHSHIVTQVKWYPVDSGVFLSSDACGSILLWDTNTFTPVTGFSISPHRSLSRTAAVNGMCSVSCMDMPNPNSNPSHLLLAVGSTRTSSNHQSQPGLPPLDDRVIRLCDIKSGSVSHQLIGHGLGRNGFGGVNVLQWSPTQEFQLASGGNDGCVKVFDVRKSGSGACLFTLDRQKKSVKFGERIEDGSGTNVLPAKRSLNPDSPLALAPSNYSMAECSSRIQSHGGSVDALSFTPDGKYIVSASGYDQQIHLWDIQPGSHDGVLIPTMFLGDSDSAPHPIERQQKKIAFHVTQSGSERTATLWVGGSGSLLLGYELHGMGGRPDKVLSGHLDKITSIATQENYIKLYTGCKDGMILSWGWKSDLN